MVRNCDITNSDYLWKFIFDEYVDEMEYAILQRVANDEGIEKASTTCLVGHVEKAKEGNLSSLNVDACSDDDCHDCDSHNLNDFSVESCDEENIDMSRA